MTDSGLAGDLRNRGSEAEDSGSGIGDRTHTHPSAPRWSDNERARIVSESYEPGASIAAVARRHGVSDTALSKWRRRARKGALPVAWDPSVSPPFVPLVVEGASHDQTVVTDAHGGVVGVPVESPVDRIVAVASGLGARAAGSPRADRQGRSRCNEGRCRR